MSLVPHVAGRGVRESGVGWSKRSVPVEVFAEARSARRSVDLGSLERTIDDAPAGDCEHREATSEVVFGVREDGAGNVTERVMRLKAKCAGCGVQLRFVVGSAAPSSVDGDFGVVVQVDPG